MDLKKDQATAKILLSALPGKERLAEFFEELSYEDYLNAVAKNPKLARTSYERMHDMLMEYGTRKYIHFKEEMTHYNFFDDPIFKGKNALFGLDKNLMQLTNFYKAAAERRGHERRILLLVGPVASGKSTVLDLLKGGYENYSKTDKGKLYSLFWKIAPDDEEGLNILGSVSKYEQYRIKCPIHEEPLRLIPQDGGLREEVIKNIGWPMEIEGSACPLCRYYFQRFLERYQGDWQKVLREHVGVYRLILSEMDRRGIGTFQPVDEKNQDSTELTGDINYRKLAEFGAEDDPRVFNFRYGEFAVANRGLLEFKEVLKLDDAFLYPLLEASQSHKIKPKGFSAIEIDEIIIGHTNEPEFKKLQKNERMEAFKDRSVVIDIPNMTVLSEEIRIYERDYGEKKTRGIHIAPHTFEMLSLWMVGTRIKPPTRQGLNLLQKIRVYDGKTLPGLTEDIVKELKKDPQAEREGLEGLSPRYAQNILGNLLVKEGTKCINSFMLFGEDGALQEGLHEHNPLVGDKNKVKEYKELLPIIKEEFEAKVKGDVKSAVIGDVDAIKNLFANYMDQVWAHVDAKKVKDGFGNFVLPNEDLMRSIEEKMDPPIPESRKDDTRRGFAQKVGSLGREGKKFEWDSDDRLRKALELKLFEDRQDTIKLESMVSTVMDDETRKKIDVVKTFMKEKKGYCDECAKAALLFVSSVFAKGGSGKTEKKK